jgi:hypothetical protein
MQLRLCLVSVYSCLCCADIYSTALSPPRALAVIYPAILLPDAVSFYLPACLVEVFQRAAPPSHHSASATAGRGHNTFSLTQAKAIAADTSRLLPAQTRRFHWTLPPTSVYSVPSHPWILYYLPLTLQHMPAHASIAQHAQSYALTSP